MFKTGGFNSKDRAVFSKSGAAGKDLSSFDNSRGHLGVTQHNDYENYETATNMIMPKKDGTNPKISYGFGSKSIDYPKGGTTNSSHLHTNTSMVPNDSQRPSTSNMVPGAANLMKNQPHRNPLNHHSQTSSQPQDSKFNPNQMGTFNSCNAWVNHASKRGSSLAQYQNVQVNPLEK